MKIKTRLFASGIFIVVVILIVLYTQDLGRVNTKNIIGDTTLSKEYVVDTNNVRIKQWLHYWRQNITPAEVKARNFYYNRIVEAFIERGISYEYAKIYAELPGVECSWNTTRYPSNTTARGLWQFTEARAIDLGLKKEDRLDAYLSTLAAAAGFLELEETFDKNLDKVLFAYHAGVGTLTAMKRIFKTDNAWLYEFPNRETYNFCPKVLGLVAYYRINDKIRRDSEIQDSRK
jgi:hypothetical protein